MSNIAIYGIGAFGKLFYASLDKQIDFFIDDFATQTSYDNKPIKKLSQIDTNTTIYISVLQYSKKIEQDLKEKRFSHIINFTNSIKTIPNILKNISQTDFLWLVKEKANMINEKKLQNVQSLLSDKKSKDILQSIVNLRKTLDPKFYITPNDIEYFPSDIPMISTLNKVNFIDCGAYIGDTINELTKQTKNINYTMSFEPDQTNLIKLQDQLAILKKENEKTNFLIYPSGVYSKNDILQFSNNGISSSAGFNENSNIKVPVVALDTIILNSSPTYIKMDIEGAEQEALLGANKTIQKYKPNLAICLYHKPKDLWEIPLLIHQIEPSYNMYIRVHEDLCLSTVLYCIPKERQKNV